MQISFKSLPVKSRTLLNVNWASRENGYLIEREAFDSKSSDKRSCVLNNESFLTQKQPGHYYLFRFKCLWTGLCYYEVTKEFFEKALWTVPVIVIDCWCWTLLINIRDPSTISHYLILGIDIAWKFRHKAHATIFHVLIATFLLRYLHRRALTVLHKPRPTCTHGTPKNSNVRDRLLLEALQLLFARLKENK